MTINDGYWQTCGWHGNRIVVDFSLSAVYLAQSKAGAGAGAASTLLLAGF
jgi:hypothetical protein